MKRIYQEARRLNPARQSWILHFLCGALIGGGAILPGVSGGVLAVVFGVYGPLMELLSHPRRAFPRYRALLLPLGLGWGIGFLLLAKGLSAVMDLSGTATAWLFVGLIAGTIPSLFREAGREGRTVSAWISLVLCAGATFGSLFYIGRVLHMTVEPNGFWYLFCGALWGGSVVIPGLTSASIMMALGLYQPMLESLSRMEVGVLCACLPGMGLTVLLLARGMVWLLETFHAVVFHGILGIVLASTAAIVPTRYSGAGEAAVSALLCLGGFALALWMSRLDARLSGET